MAFEEAAAEWRALLKEVGEAFVVRHLDDGMRLAVALHCQSDEEAEQLAEASVPTDSEAVFLELVGVLRRLVETAVRGRMTFLLPSEETNSPTLGSSQRAELARQRSLIERLPETFQLRFRQTLDRNWSRLTAAPDSTFALPRMQQLDYSVAAEASGARRVLLRLQTRDNRLRTVQVPLKQFHQLRYSAAAVLQEMNQAEAHPMMRLAYMEQSSRVGVAAGVEAQSHTQNASNAP